MTFWNETDKRMIEKKRIKRVANAIGGAFLLGTAVTIAVQFVLIALGYTDALSTTGGMWLMQVLLSAFMFTVPFCITAPAMNIRISGVCGYSKPEKGTALPLIACGLGACMLANVLGSITSSFFEALGITDAPSSLMSLNEPSLFNVVISVFGGAALPALVEEFALRGVVLGSLRRFGDNFAIIVSAALFGIMHGTVSQIPFAFFLGIYLGFTVVKSGSVWTAVAIHFINNACAFLIDLFASELSARANVVLNGLYFMVMIAIGFIGFFTVKTKNLFSLPVSVQDNTEDKLTLVQKTGAFFSAPCVVIYIAVVCFEILITQLERLLTL